MNTSPSNTSPTDPTTNSLDQVARATVVLVDPTSPDGETSIAALRETDEHVLVVVLATGRSCNALRDRAHEQGTSVLSAAWSYLEQIAVRISRPGRIVGTIVATGPDPAYELASVVAEHPTDRVILPASAARLDRMLPRRLARSTAVAIESSALLSA